ncbi:MULTISPECIES: D-glyceraldehyde dehydrogenase [Acidiplasma]|jgi:D-glyceraldehyde dehydrogenase (NADP+)|uniref:D-glyceraldehyde dehydrogenase (NADP(+)) n=2 Tax=Acidiplasma TaxID=507753 RepID=A0A0Q0RGU3_9ARCH|nr:MULTISPECIES: D-glyceraldehyde dehydrogenase [Acidiplasma]KJE49561.1 aldehyde dehydrogenase [Acidiplasma sp. MBA-1]KPV44977.1 aldehyde dehydrogenase [Acidiplasma aeolicum]KQB34053.1 aldehyde dehydrogenase [Acidiplasma aeolicum]KQB34386.1 aldehyde dehydrogenase [Acidiplasma cupricumulans]WMT54167.1 MAG: D-glyceraldehyde dehydrogenase [Acidiplasma sp.]
MQIYINGEWRDSSSKDVLNKYNPANGQVIDTFPAATKTDVDDAVDAAEDSFEGWYNLGTSERAKILFKAAHLIAQNREELENLLMLEVGKIKREASDEVDGVLDQINYYAEFERKLTGQIVEGTNSKRKIFQYKVPYGVVVAITPWNFPAAMVARKLAPALLTGNTIVLKPSSDTPLTAAWIVKKFIEAGVPKGVLNLITGKGSEIGDYIVQHKKVSLVTMTGSTSTGQKIMQNASNNMAKLILELGGKAPFIVWKDADIRRTLKCITWAKYLNVGQSCIAAERLYIHEDIYDEFMKKFLEVTKRIKIGNPETADLGPLINKSALKNIQSVVENAKESGYKILTGGNVPNLEEPYRNGYFFEPTVIEDVNQDSPIFQEEIFGPVIGTEKISTTDELYRKANDSKYGLASYLFTEDPELMLEASEKIRFGELYINMPGPEASQGYHTGFRMTGQAGEGSIFGINEYLKVKNVYIDYSRGDLKINTVRDSLFDNL